MIGKILKRMSGEELLLMRILKGDGVGPVVEDELKRRASSAGWTRRYRKDEAYWTGRTFAMRRSARLAA